MTPERREGASRRAPEEGRGAQTLRAEPAGKVSDLAEGSAGWPDTR